MASIKQIKANRINAIKGGPKTIAGKSISRLNALKHGILAAAITPHDDPQFRALCDNLVADLKPNGTAEEMLTDMIALNYLRLQRCARAEAEYHIKTWEPRTEPYDLRLRQEREQAGQHTSWFNPTRFRESVELFGRYSTTLTNQILKLMHDLERLQRMRQEEGLPLAEPEVSPTVADPVQPPVTNAAPEPPPASPVPETHSTHPTYPTHPSADPAPAPKKTIFPNEPNLPQAAVPQHGATLLARDLNAGVQSGQCRLPAAATPGPENG